MGSMIEKTWPEWVDPLGQVYRPGDYVAIAVINNKSPQMVLGKVVKINRLNSKHEEIVERGSDRVKDPLTGKGRWEYWERPSCTVQVQPIIDGRRFGRGSYWWEEGKPRQRPKLVTYQFPGNIVKVVASEAFTEIEESWET